MRTNKWTRLGRLFITAIYAAAAIWLPFSITASAAPALPANYTLTPVATGANFPTNLAWLPDGTMLIAEKNGIVKARKDGVTQAQPFINIASSTNDYWDRGLLGITVDPDYNTNHYIYMMRTFENNAADYTGSKVGQLVRVTINPATNQMVPGSLTVLVGKDTAASCNDLAVTADCMPSDSPSHGVGDVMFAPDGTLYVTSGDGASFTETDPQALRSQNLDSLAGKMLHIDRNGKAVPGNPYHNGNADANRSKVWAYGLRNPWRIVFKPGTTMPYIAEVGWGDWEEVNVATPGANFGWPCYEGAPQHPSYGNLSGCQQLYTRVANGQTTVKAPLTAWNHSGYSGAAVGGTFVTGSQYPAELQGSYLFGDYANEFIRTLRTNDTHALSQGPNDFIDGFPGLVSIEQGPDGYVYLVSITDATFSPNTGTVYRLDYGTPPPPPDPGDCTAGQFEASYFNNKTLSGTPALVRCENAPLNHNWGVGAPAAGIGADNFSSRYTGTFTFTGGNHLFEGWADDGVRIYLDGQLVVNGWKDQAYTRYENTVPVTAGQHTVTVEFYDALEDGAVRAQWTPLDTTPPPPPTGCDPGQYKAEYFNNKTMTGTPALTRCEAAPLNHNWALAAPGAGVNADNFSARYTGAFTFAAGNHKFEGWADDGVRISIDGAQVLNGWKDQAYTHYENTANVTAGQHVVTVEFYDALQDAAVRAQWTPVDTTPPPPTGECAAGQFKAEYFNSVTPGGTAALTRCENAPINHNWVLASPGTGVNTENFSVRWSGNFTFDAAQYRFDATADDGVRIFIDGNMVLNGWKDQGATHYEATANVTAGTHAVVVEFYDKLEDATIQASWTKLGGTGGNTAPVAAISNPAPLSAANIGSTVTFSGSATDAEDGTIPAANLHWNAVINHCGATDCHAHFMQQFTGSGGSFTYPDHGPDNYYIDLSLTATDSNGTQSTIQTVRIDPNRAPATCPADWYKGEYFNNKTLTGTPVATSCSQNVDFDWVYASPLAGVNADNFSVRFTSAKQFEAGNYRFSITGDDGIRLFIDDALAVNGWFDQAATTYTANRNMTVGTHNLRLEFYDATEDAVAKLSWIKL